MEFTPSIVLMLSSRGSTPPLFSSWTNLIIIALRPNATGCISVRVSSMPVNAIIFLIVACSTSVRLTSGEVGMILMVTMTFAIVLVWAGEAACVARVACANDACLFAAHECFTALRAGEYGRAYVVRDWFFS